jgi:hypothetical protein
MVNGVELRLLVPSKNAFQYLNQSLGMLTVPMDENLDRSVDTTAMAASISRVLEKTSVALMENGQFPKHQIVSLANVLPLTLPFSAIFHAVMIIV